MTLRLSAMLASAGVASVLAFPAAAEEFRIDRLFVVGDSLSDGGAYSQSTIAAYGGGQVTRTGFPAPTPDLDGDGIPDQPRQAPNIRYKFLDNAPDGSSQVYAEVLADELGIDPLLPDVINGVPALTGAPLPTGALANDVPVDGNNYAQGGSRVSQQPGIGNNPAFGITTVPVVDQVDRLLADTPTLTDSDLVIVWGGANDVFAQAGAVGAGAITPQQAVGNMTQAAFEQNAQVARLKEAGAGQVVVVTVPDIGQNTPFGVTGDPQAAALQTALVDAFNRGVALGQSDTDYVIVDSDKLLTAVLDDPVRYGFSDINQRTTAECTVSSVQCIQGVTTLSDGNQRVFADGVHPTGQAHALFGQAAFAGIQGATQAGVIPVATLSALRQQSIGLEQRLNLGAFYKRAERDEPLAEARGSDYATAMFPTGERAVRDRVAGFFDGTPGPNRVRREVGDVEVYGGAEFGFYEADGEQLRPGFEADTQVVKVAADVMVSEHAMVGAGISLDHGQVDFDDDLGGFDSRLIVGALFGVVELTRGVYVNGAAGYGYVDVYDIERRFQLGAATERYDGDTDGNYFVGKASIGAMLPVGGGFVVNPSLGFTYEKVDLDGYTERAREGGGATLAFDDLEFESQRITAALAGYYSPPALEGWTFGLRGSYEKDLEDDDVIVTFGPDRARLGETSAPRPDDDFGYLTATVAKDFGNSTLTLQGSTVLGLDGVDGYTGSLVYKLAF